VKTLVLGRGRVGTALAEALRAPRAADAGVRVRAGAGSSPREEDLGWAEAVVLAIPDGALEGVAARIAGWLEPSAVALHCAGARTAEALGACRRRGCPVGVMHPLASFADAATPPSLAAIHVFIAGDPRAVDAARTLAAACGATPVVVEAPAQIPGPAYHAAAALVANGTAGLAYAGVETLLRLGVERREAEAALGALLRTVAGHIERLGLPAALTGPVVRGDAVLVDGGVLNPVPIAPTFGDGTDLTIAVNLGGLPVYPAGRKKPKTSSKAGGFSYTQSMKQLSDLLGLPLPSRPASDPGLLDVANRAFDSMQNSIARQKLASYPPDQTIEIPRNACGMLDFDRAAEMIELGRKEARRCLEQIARGPADA